MKNTIILFLLFIGLQSMAQYEDWPAVKIGSDDMGKIYVGSSLVWEKCEYGQLSTKKIYSIINKVTYSNCSDITITSLADAKLVIDREKDGTCTPNGYDDFFVYIKATAVDNYVLSLDVSYNPVCELTELDGWFLASLYLGLHEESDIIFIDSGVITYSEYY